jgi:hypothetical protein
VTPDLEQDKTFGDLDPVYAYTTSPDEIASVLPNGNAVALSGTLTREPGEDVNTYNILQGNINNAENPNYDISFTEDVLFEINRLDILVTADAGQDKTYGDSDPLPFTYASNPAIGSLLANEIVVALSGDLGRVAGENVGYYALLQGDVDNTVNPNYNITFVSNDFEITRLAIVLTPDAGQKKIYGEAEPLPFTYTTVPAIGSELDNGLPVGLTGSLAREAGETVGFYNILQGDVDNTENPNYSLSFTENVTFEIERKDIVINVIIDQSKEYGDADPVYDYTSLPDENDLPFNASFVGALTRVTGENVGNDYAILQGTLELDDDNNGATSLAQNYNVTFNSADFEITLKEITILVAANQSKVYGEFDPVFTFSSLPAIATLPFDAAWTGVLVRVPGEVVYNDYTILQGSLELIDANNPGGGSLAANYAVTFWEDYFEITRKPITITVDPEIAKSYGDPDPVFTFSSVPALGDLPFTAEWIGSLEREDIDENTGSYTITQGTLELDDTNNDLASLAQNYTVTFNTDELTINKRDISIIVAADQSKVYADNDPVFEYQSNVDPLYFNGSFTGLLERVAGENVADDYAINLGSLQIDDDNNALSLDNNYNLTFIPANFEITKKPITIMVGAGQNKKYGFDDPVFTYQSSVDPLPFNGDFTGALVREEGKDVAADYTISRGSLQIVDENHATSLDHNYELSFVGDDFEILTRPVTITADNRNKTYGDLMELGTTEFSISGDGMAFTETIDEVTLNSDGTPVLADAGVYPIHTSNAIGSNGFLHSNYSITYSSAGILTVETRPLTLYDFGAANKTYDGSTIVIGTGWFDDRLPGDILAFSFEANFEDKNVGTNKTVNYTNIAIVGGPDQFNYHLLTVSGTATANILTKALSITANDLTKAYGNTLVFAGTEFTSAGMVNGETIASVMLFSDGTPSDAPLGIYPIVASEAVGNAGTLMTNYLITYIDGELTVEFSLLGTVSYWKNNNDVPIQNVVVKLIDNQSQVLAVATTDASGAYTFIEQNPGEIDKIEVSTSLPWGGNNSTDALAIQLKTVGLPPAYWTPSTFIDFVADVNSNNAVNATDALFVRNRSIYTIDSYPAGDWAFNAKNLGINFSNINLNTAVFNYSDLNSNVLDIRTLCFGDVNGSYNFGGAKSLISAHNEEITKVVPGMQFEIPVSVDKTIEFSALSLQLAYPADKISVVGIKSDMNGLEYNIADGFINVGWYNLNPVLMRSGDAIITLVVTSNAAIGPDDDIFFFSSETEFADKSGEVIQNYDLSMSRIDNSMEYALQCYPNPFNDFMNIGYSMVEPGEVRISVVNSLGSVVTVLADHHHLAGNHILDFSAGKYTLSKGLYFVRMEVRTENVSFTKLASVIFVE